MKNTENNLVELSQNELESINGGSIWIFVGIALILGLALGISTGNGGNG